VCGSGEGSINFYTGVFLARRRRVGRKELGKNRGEAGIKWGRGRTRE